MSPLPGIFSALARRMRPNAIALFLAVSVAAPAMLGTTALLQPTEASPKSSTESTGESLTDSASHNSAPGEVQPVDRNVSVRDPVADGEIRDRLRSILDATGRFSGASVQVSSGVVVLAGVANEESDRQLASELTRQTEGVVAVINNIQLSDGPAWTLEPAFAEARKLGREMIRAIPVIVLGLLVLAAAIGGAWLSRRLLRRPLARRIQSDLVRNVLENVAFIIVALFGSYLFLRITGLTRFAVTLAGGTGIVGLILGFAFRDIAENFLASVLLSVQRPFRVGDVIEVEGNLGVVQRVTTRGTVLMDFDGNHIQIANSTVYKNTIKNYTANPRIRLWFAIGVGYDSSITQAQAVALDVLREHSAVLDDPEPMILVEELGSATITVKVYFWINGQEHSKFKVQSSVMRQIVRAYQRAGISLPDEAREVVFPDGVPVHMVDQRHPASGGSSESVGQRSARLRDSTSDRSDEQERTESEGDFGSEAKNISDQARTSRNPEEGANILGGDSR